MRLPKVANMMHGCARCKSRQSYPSFFEEFSNKVSPSKDTLPKRALPKTFPLNKLVLKREPSKDGSPINESLFEENGYRERLPLI